jgi:hypothetical protein
MATEFSITSQASSCIIQPFDIAASLRKIYSTKYSQTWLKQHRFIKDFIYSIRYFAVPINSSLLTIALYSLVIITLVYNDKRYSAPLMTL